MRLDDRLYALLASHAARVNIEQVCVGLRYTAVTLSDGGIGLAYTWPHANERTLLPSADTGGRRTRLFLEKVSLVSLSFPIPSKE